MSTDQVKNLRKVLKNVVWLLFERGSQIALLLVLNGYLARTLGPSVYGKWQYAISLLFLATTLTYVCSAEVIVPRLIRNPEAVGTILGTAFFLRGFASLATFIVGQFAVYFYIPDIQVAIFLHILLFLVLLNEPFGVITASFQAKTNIAPVVKARLIALVVKCLLIVIALSFFDNSLLVAVAWVGEGVVVVALLLILYRRSTTAKWNIVGANIGPLFSEGMSFFLGFIFFAGFTRLDRLFLAEYATYAQLGIYSVALQICENWFVIATIASQSIAPKYFFVTTTPEAVDKNLQNFILVYVVFSVGGASLIALSATFLIYLVFGVKYAGAAALLRWLVTASPFVFLDSLFNILMIQQGAKTWIVGKWVAAFAVAFIINYLLIPSIGVYAPIISVISGYFIAALLGVSYWLNWRRNAIGSACLK